MEHPFYYRIEHDWKSAVALPATGTLCPHEDRTLEEPALSPGTLCSIVFSILLLDTLDMSSSPSVVCWLLLVTNSVDNKMCDEAGALIQMSLDSRNLGLALSQMETLELVN